MLIQVIKVVGYNSMCSINTSGQILLKGLFCVDDFENYMSLKIITGMNN